MCVKTVRWLIVWLSLSGYSLQAAVYEANSNSEVAVNSLAHQQAVLRQGSFWDWISSIFNPGAIVTTTTTPMPGRECRVDCTCGRINKFNRIVGGNETEVHEYPWMALLLSRGNFFCGGSLVNDLYVLTAAHCLYNANVRDISVHLLEHNRDNSEMNVISRNAAKLTINSRYNPSTLDNDIALIRLSEPVQFTDTLRPVCLPTPVDTFAGRDAVATGWGALSEGGPASVTLQEVTVPVLTNIECRMMDYPPTAITENMLCAGFEEGGKDSCQGDSGGPLHVAFLEGGDQYQQPGIVSWGYGCARPNTPGVYTRVNNYLDWIATGTADGCGCPVSKHIANELN